MKKEREKKIVASNVLELLPVVKYVEDAQCFESTSGTYPYIDLLKINSKDRRGMDQEDIEGECRTWQKFYLTYTDDIKIFASNFHVDTSKQCDYYRKKLARTKNPVYRTYLAKELSIYQNIGTYKKNRAFMMMIFAESKKKMAENLELLDGYLGIGENGRVLPISREEKEDFLYQLYNKGLMMGGR